MSEEEKNIVEFLKDSMFVYEELDTSVLEYIDEIHKKIFKLIEKQQKEIEELKYLENKTYQDYAKLKQKIRDKLEKIKEDEEFYREQDRYYEFEGKIRILGELLEEGD